VKQASQTRQKESTLAVPVKKLLKAVEPKKITGNTEIQIRSLQYDSRQIGQGDMFVAIKGFQKDGHEFIPQAIKNGAVSIVAEKEDKSNPSLKIVVEDSRLALARLSQEYYNNPSTALSVVGVTGTNGKTTITYWLKSILDEAGQKSGLIGTVKYYIGEQEISATRTTPESLDLQALLAQMLQSGIKTVVMEVSSHALELKRVFGIDFRIAIFTNLTREHLDFHGTMENYKEAKGILFRNLSVDSFVILNSDDPNSEYYASLTEGKRIFYSTRDKNSQFYAKEFEFSPAGTEATFTTPAGEQTYSLRLTGEFNLSNFGAVLAAAHSLGLGYEQIKKGAEKFTGAPGRMERIDLGQDFNIWIDYAHTPDGMERVFTTIKSFTKGRLISLFGCGGDRDKGKRPQMGKMAEKYADLIILSSDNPRSEEPAQIIEDILQGITGKRKVQVILDRKEALEYAVSAAKPDDSILVTGKGHENYQEIKGVKYPFSERAIIEEALTKLGYSKK
jgi:UDP-N-acetylmuramoyl-L-alanyl-D-glutamate--2,6-diaminopimelate ligase